MTAIATKTLFETQQKHIVAQGSESVYSTKDEIQVTVSEIGESKKTQNVLMLHAIREKYTLVQDHDIPSILNKDEILVKVIAVGLNPIDWKAPAFNFGIPTLPWINGRDLAGVVVKVGGKDSRLHEGDTVLVPSTDYRDIRKAAFQEYAITTHYNASRIPYTVSVEESASLGVAFVASALALGISLGLDFSTVSNGVPKGPNIQELLMKVDLEEIPEDVRDESFSVFEPRDRVKKGDWIAIWGASTTTGYIGLQLAKLSGLRVICIADIARHGAKLLEAGADLLVDRLDTGRAIEIIRSITGGKLRYGIDTVGKETATLLQEALFLSQDGSRKAHLLGLTGIPREKDARIHYHTVPIKVFHTCPSVGLALSTWLESLLEANVIRLPEVVYTRGGLGAINDALDILRKGSVSGTREIKVHKNKDIDHWISLAQKLEKAKFHAIFFADDVLGGYDVYNGPANLEPTIPAAAQFPINDPLYSIPALAAATKNISFGVTASTTYDQPYALARRFSTVDHLSKVRVGWNIVTSYLDSAARNLGLDTQVEHDERYRIADEYLNVTYKLWEGSWRDNAVKNDKSGYADPHGVRQINHEGKYFKVPGLHLCEPSRQRTPFLLQAGTSTAGKAFAAKHTEAIFLNGHSPELIRPSVDSIRKQAAKFGRNPKDIKIIAGALALFGGWSGYDLSKYTDDQDMNYWAKTVPGTQGKKWDKKAIADFVSLGGNDVSIVGDAKHVADELENWVQIADVDGFNMSYASVPKPFDDVIKFLLPELKARRLFWDDYAVKGGTFREQIYGQKGHNRLPDSHPGAQYFWKAGEKVPAYASKSSAS